MKQFLKFTLATIVGVILASLLGTLIMLGIFGAIVSSGDKPTKLSPNTVYELKLDGRLIDRSEDDPFSKALSQAFGRPETNDRLVKQQNNFHAE